MLRAILWATHIVERGDDVADMAPSRCVEHLEDDERRAGGNPRARPGRIETVASDDAGDVGAVTEVVVQPSTTVDEIDEPIDPLGAARCGQIVVPRVMPESMTATPTPEPSYPSVWRTAAAPIVAAVRSVAATIADPATAVRRAGCRRAPQLPDSEAQPLSH